LFVATTIEAADAKTGAVSQAGGPAFNGYQSFRFGVLWGIPIRKLASQLEHHYFYKGREQ